MRSFLLSLITAFCLSSVSLHATVIYVDSSNILGTHNGSSWAAAFNQLQDGINTAAAGDSVWVAKGSYSSSNSNPFAMKEGVRIYGGFLKTYSSFSQRDFNANLTVLKGNAYNIMRNVNNGLTNAALIDGFIFTKGYSNDNSGGAMSNYNASPTVANCLFYDNVVYGSSSYKGGAVFNYNSAPRFINCIFNYNRSNDDGGGAIYNSGSDMVAINCLFIKNYAYYGGAIYNTGSNPSIINCTMSQNKAEYDGSSVFYNIFSSPDIRNSIIWGNYSGAYGSGGPESYSLMQYLAAGDPMYHMIDGSVNPLFVDTAAGDFRLQINSPCRNAGSNTFVNADILTDLYGNARIKETTVDMGAIESGMPVVYLGNDTAVCVHDPLVISAVNPAGSYLWNTGATTPAIAVDTSGTYYVTVSNLYGSSSDTIHITVNPLPLVSLGNDTILLPPATLILNAQNTGADYLWNTGAQTQTITVNSAGIYSVQVTDDNGCKNHDSITVQYAATKLDDISRLNNDIDVFPVPANKELHIANRTGRSIDAVEIKNISGQTVYHNEQSFKEEAAFQLDNMPPGIYTLHISIGSSRLTRKIIISK